MAQRSLRGDSEYAISCSRCASYINLKSLCLYGACAATEDGGLSDRYPHGAAPAKDCATGWAEPNGLPCIQGVTGETTGAPLKKEE